MGIGTYGDDFAAQLFEPAEVVRGGEKAAAAVHAAGVQLQPLAFFREGAKNLVDQLPVIVKGNRTGAGVAHGFSDVGQVRQHVIVRVHLHTGQGLLKAPPLRLKYGFPLPEGAHIHIQPVHKMDGTKNKIKVTAAQILTELFKVIPGHAEFHAPPDFQPRHRQRIILGAILIGVKGHIAHGSKGVIVNMIRKADFGQPRLRRGKCHGQSGVLSVKGHPGMHMIVKHFISPRIGGMPWAEPPAN